MATVMPRTGLSRPVAQETDWDANLNGWLTKLDTYGGFTDLAATWTALQTFNNVTIGGGTIAFTKDSTPLASSGVLYTSPATMQATSTDFLHAFDLEAAPSANRVFRLTTSGTYAWGSGTMSYGIRIEGTQVTTTPTFTAPGAAGNWSCEASVLVYNSASVAANMVFKIDDDSATPARVYGKSLLTAPNLTVPPQIATHITMSGSMTFVQNFCLLEMLN